MDQYHFYHQNSSSHFLTYEKDLKHIGFCHWLFKSWFNSVESNTTPKIIYHDFIGYCSVTSSKEITVTAWQMSCCCHPTFASPVWPQPDETDHFFLRLGLSSHPTSIDTHTRARANAHWKFLRLLCLMFLISSWTDNYHSALTQYFRKQVIPLRSFHTFEISPLVVTSNLWGNHCTVASGY